MDDYYATKVDSGQLLSDLLGLDNFTYSNIDALQVNSPNVWATLEDLKYTAPSAISGDVIPNFDDALESGIVSGNWGAAALALVTNTASQVPNRRQQESMLMLGFDPFTQAPLSPTSVSTISVIGYEQAYIAGGLPAVVGSINTQNIYIPYLLTHGYYVPESGDSWATAAGIASGVNNYSNGTLSGAELQRLNKVLPGGSSSVTAAGLVYVPTLTQNAASGTFTPNGQTVVIDSTSRDGGTIAYTMGASLDGSETGSLFILNNDGGYLRLDAGSWSQVVMGTSGSDVTASITLVSPSGATLGTLTLDTNTDAMSLKAANGDIFTLPSAVAQELSLPSSISAPTLPPEQLLQNYLTQLGYSGPALVSANFTDLNPSGTAYTVTGTVVGVNGNTAANVTYTVPGTDAPGAQVTGQSTAIVNGNSVPATNYLSASGDISQDAISGISVLDTGGVSLTSAQWNSFASIAATGNAAITLTGGGTISLTDPRLSGSVGSLAATGWNGATLIGSNTSNQVLTASLFGNDSLTAGNGTGDYLYAGEGVDTLVGGSGGDKFIAQNGLAAGTTVTGSGTGNTLQAGGDISGAFISGIQTLALGLAGYLPTITLSAAQFSGFATITGAHTLNFATGGTYDFTGKTVSGGYTLDALSGSNTTIKGNDIGSAVTYVVSGDGNDSITTGNAVSDTVTVTGNGNDTIVLGTGGSDRVTITGDGRDTVSGGGAGENITASGGSGTLTLGNGNSSSITVTTGGYTLQAGSGSGDSLSAKGGYNTLLGGTSATTFNLWDDDNTATGGAGNDTFNLMGASDGSGGSSIDLSGTTINGGAGTNSIVASGFDLDISNATISNIQSITANTVTLTSAQLAAIGGATHLHVSSYTLATADATYAPATGVLAANAEATAEEPGVTTVAVTDTAANVSANIDALEALGAQLASITLTDSGTPALALTAEQLSEDAGALATITGSWTVATTGMNVASALGAAGAAAGAVAISDTAADVSANLDALAALGPKIASIAFTDPGTPVLSVTAAQAVNDASVLGAITGAYTLSVSGAVPAAAAATLAALPHAGTVAVTDTAANVAANLTALQTLAAGGKLASITLTDPGTPALALAYAQYTADAAALGLIAGSYAITVSGVPAANAASVAGGAHVTSVAVSDTAANIAANIAALETLASGTELASIAVTGTPTAVTLTYAQYTADTAALAKFTGTYSFTITNVPAANAAATGAGAHVGSISVSDASANVVTNLAALQALGTKLSAIALTDGGTPALSLTGATYTADSAAVAKITTPYTITLSAVTAASAATDAGNTHVTGISISDTAANIAANIASLQTLAASGSVLASITVTNNTTPIPLTYAQYTGDTAALAKLTGTWSYAVSVVAAANAASVAGAAHVASVSVSDTSADVVANLAALQALGTKLTSIALTDGGTPVLAVSGTTYVADASTLAKITGSYQITISNLAAANVSSANSNSHVTSITVSDTAANVVTNLAALQTANAKITSIALTDGGTPTLAITGAQLTADSAALSKITGSYNLTVSAVTAANAASAAAAAHVTSITVSDTAANIAANIASLQTLATSGSVLASITVTNSSTPIPLTLAQYTSDTAALAKLTGTYSYAVSGVAAANATSTAGAAHVASVSVSDTSADVLANLTALQALGTKLTAIALTDGGTPVLSLTGATYTADVTTLNKITTPYTISLSSTPVSEVSAANSNSHVTGIAVSDTAANVNTGISGLETANAKITAITLTDASTPTLNFTVGQTTSNAAAIAKIVSAYNESVTADVNVTEAITATGARNTISFVNANHGVTVNLATGSAIQTNGTTNYTDTLNNFENVTGSAYADTITGGNDNGVLTGNGGADTYILQSSGYFDISDTAAHLNGTTIQDLTATSVIDLTTVAFGVHTTLGFSEDPSNTFGTLTVSDGTHTAAIQLLGQFTAANFQTASDTGSGTLVAYEPAASLTTILAAAHAG